MKFYFSTVDAFYYNGKTFRAGLYSTENVDFIRTAQAFIHVLGEQIDTSSFRDFDSMQKTEIVIEKDEETITVEVQEDGDIEVDVAIELRYNEEGVEKLTLEAVEEAIEKIDVTVLEESTPKKMSEDLPGIEE